MAPRPRLRLALDGAAFSLGEGSSLFIAVVLAGVSLE
jgi:hypothetical protein